MARWIIGLVVCMCLVSPSLGQEKQAKPVLELWDSAYLQGAKAGYVHTIVQEIGTPEEKLLRSTMEMRLHIKRNGQALQIGMDTGTTESAEGKVTGVFMRQFLGKQQKLEIQGVVDGPTLKLTRDGVERLRPAPWNDRVLGIYRQQQMFRDKNLKPGDSFEFVSFEPSINLVVKQKVEAKDYEEVELFGGKSKARLLRVETRSNKVQGVALPALISWLNEDLTPVRMETDAPGLGMLTLYRTSKQVALAPGAVANLTDVGLTQYVKLNKKILKPHETASAAYRVTIRDDDDPGSAFSRDDRQEIKNLSGKTFDLHVKSSRGPDNSGEANKIGTEFMESSYFINSNDAKVKEHARRAVGGEKDAWKKALRIERWVHDKMTPVNDEALATADHVARTLEGDCTEYAMLAAAMCRAEGIPSRTAIGLVYADVKSGPVFAFHMWTEVAIKGKWLPIDATLGKGHVGAAHLKISDQSWHEQRTMTPLLPVVRVLGRVSIEVLDAENR